MTGSYNGAPLTTPDLGQPITDDNQNAYRTRASAYNQASQWNQVLKDDPIHGPTTGYQVGVAPIPTQHSDGSRWDLIWIPAATTRH